MLRIAYQSLNTTSSRGGDSAICGSLPLESKNVTGIAASHAAGGIDVNRKQTDIAVGALIVAIVVLGVLSVVQLLVRDGSMSGGMGSMPVIAMVGPVLMSLVIASIIGGVYMFVRSQIFRTQASSMTAADGANDTGDTTDTSDGSEPVAAETEERQPSGGGTRRPFLEVLPDDERRILEPVIESPGLTQITVRDRSGFSKSKVSQTITDLEKRGLLYRESQGRTYRVYPAEDFEKQF